MRFVTWNMGRKKATHEAAWAYLLTELKPDVALIQEALVSSETHAASYGSVTWYRANRSGGTGILVRRGINYTRHTVGQVGDSYIAGILLSLRGIPTSVFSVHVGPRRWATQQALKSWLIALKDQGPFVLGGDLNTSRDYKTKHRAFFENLNDAGIHDCHFKKNRKEIPSFWGRQAKREYQDDHFFTTGPIGESVHECRVVDNPVVRVLSDHGPVVLDISDE